MTNGLSHRYHLGEYPLIIKGFRSNFKLSYKFLMNILLANRIAPDGTPHYAGSYLGLYCLPMSHRKAGMLK